MKDYFDTQEDYDAYIENTPLEARFDPTTISMLVVEAIPKHRAYEMTFAEYLKERSHLAGYDTTEKKQISFYLPLFPAMRSQDFAHENKVSLNQFMVSILELGLITFLYDYHAEVTAAKQAKQDMGQYLTNSRAKMRYLQIAKQKIVLGSTVGAREGASKHFVPRSQEWFHGAMTDMASYLNMTVSDLAYLSWCVGVSKTLPSGSVDIITDQEVHSVMDAFNFELEIYANYINGILGDIKNDSELSVGHAQ